MVLSSPAVSAVQPVHESTAMLRTASKDVRTDREDLRSAAEQSLNVILDLDLQGHIRWVSPSWRDVVGTNPDSVKGVPISSLCPSNPTVFAHAIESMRADDSKSRHIRFQIGLGPDSQLDSDAVEDNKIVLKGQGIMVYERGSQTESHVSHAVIPSDADRRPCGC